MPAQILLVDPDPAVQQSLTLNFSSAGYRVDCCADAETALLRLARGMPDLVLLEWTLPGQSGETLVRRLRAQATTRALGLIMLTGRSAETDKVMALESGADDYVTKPFSPRELLARTQAVLRRVAPPADTGILLGGLRLDPDTLQVSDGGRPILLGPIEFRLLAFLMRHPERVHSRPQLLDRVWGRHAVLDERTVDTHVGRLRQALGPDGQGERIQTVRGAGYRFAAGVPILAGRA
jgi:two-component system phosphate regulon response regulator PhoB